MAKNRLRHDAEQLCATAHDIDNFHAGEQLVIRIRKLIRGKDTDLGGYKIIIERIR